MRTLFLMALLSMAFLKTRAGDIQYATAFIPEALLKNAAVVKRSEEISFELVNTGKTIMHQKYALTILNESGADYAVFYEWYNKMRQIKLLEGSLYDAGGKLLKHVKRKDFQDLSAVDDNNLIDDSRMRRHSFYYRVYPYTVEYEVEIESNNSYSFPRWTPQETASWSVAQSKLTVVTPEGYNVRYKMFQYSNKPEVASTKGHTSYTWQVKDLPAQERETAAPAWHELTPSVYLAPSAFEMAGFKGDATSWEALGKFQVALNKDRDVLPANVLQQVQLLTAGVADTREKVRVLYRYMQQHTRYISIQLGIGGLQPFEARSVAQNGYGDCKALSNYMYSLLKAAGIPSYYTWVHAGRTTGDRYLIEDFPSDQFNHIILCVPLAKDSMWLECTSQTVEAGYMGAFTGNRKALLITEDGGKLVSTPRYGLLENVQLRHAAGIIDAEGNLQVNVATTYGGTQQDGLDGMINYLSKERVKETLNEALGLSTYDINAVDYKAYPGTVPQLAEKLQLSVARFATITGKRLYLTPNLLNRSQARLAPEERKNPIVYQTEWRDVDSVMLEVPAGYKPESIPQNSALKNKFGAYSLAIRLEGNKLFYVRTREQYAGTFAASNYAELVTFFETIYKADRSQVVLKREE